MGFLDTHPRGRELIHVLVAQRAARALGDLMMHETVSARGSREVPGRETPRGWLREDANTVWG